MNVYDELRKIEIFVFPYLRPCFPKDVGKGGCPFQTTPVNTETNRSGTTRRFLGWLMRNLNVKDKCLSRRESLGVIPKT